MAISVANYGAENMWFGKVIHKNLSNKMEYKEQITFDKLPNMKAQDIFPNPVFWEFTKKYKTCPNLIKREHYNVKQLLNLRGSNKKSIQIQNTQSFQTLGLVAGSPPTFP